MRLPSNSWLTMFSLPEAALTYQVHCDLFMQQLTMLISVCKFGIRMLIGRVLRNVGLMPRLQQELRCMRPFESSFAVKRAQDPTLDAWKGAAKFAGSAPASAFVTRSQYQEFGADYFAEHHSSNKRFAFTQD